MQREGREGFVEGCTPMNISDPPSDHEWINTFIDQHTANVWKAAQESMKKSILESGLLEEKINYFRCIRQEGMAEGHNQAVRAVKGFMSNMDTNSVDSIHLNKQAN